MRENPETVELYHRRPLPFPPGSPVARVDASSADGIEPAFDAIAKLGAGGVVVQFDFLLAAQKPDGAPPGHCA